MNTITFITTNIAPYRLMWFEELSNHFNIVVYYTKDKEKDREKGFLRNSSSKCKIIKLNNKDDKDNKICFDVIKAIKENKDNLIIFDGYGTLTNILGLLYCKIIKKKVFVNVDGFSLGDNMSVFMRKLKKHIVTNYCPYIFCSSEITKKHLIENGAKENNIFVHNFSSIKKEDILEKPLSFDEKMSVRKELGMNTDKPIILGVGQFIQRKRFEDLIQAVISIGNKVELYILGGKPTKEYLELVGNNKNIHFLDFVKPEEVYKYYQASNIFVLTSQTDVWGLVINEAMAQGLPVISSDNCIAGLSMINGNGVIYKTGDVKELINAINKCLDEKNYNKFAEKSLLIANEYNIEKMVERQLPILNMYFEGKIGI